MSIRGQRAWLLPVTQSERAERKDVQRMTEKRACFITGSHRGPGADISRDEPSHIHLPRRRRIVRPDDQGVGNVRSEREGEQER